MAEVIRMPRMSDTMEEGVIVGWLAKVGEQIEPGDVLAEVETDKATMELESFHEGTLLYIGVKEGPVPVNGVLAVIGEEGEDYKAALAADEAAQSGSSSPAAAEPVAETTSTTTAPASSDESTEKVKASPLARSMAKDAGVSLAQIEGSGDNGRVIKRDVLAHLDSTGAPQTAAPSVAQPIQQPQPVQQQTAAAPQPSTIAAPSFSTNAAAFEDVAVSQMRKVIARRLGESKFSAPHFYLSVEINMDKAIQTRKQLNEVSPVKISFNDLVLKASAVALRNHPAINSSWLGDRIRYNKHINIGVAVAIEDGLLVPVIKHSDMKSLSQISTEVRSLAGKAKEKKLPTEDMTGNTFTISNLGMFGIEEFTAIINPPDACILAVGGIIQKAIVKDGELAVGSIMKVTLSCDHRVVDGASGAKFLNDLKAMLEDPIRLLV